MTSVFKLSMCLREYRDFQKLKGNDLAGAQSIVFPLWRLGILPRDM